MPRPKSDPAKCSSCGKGPKALYALGKCRTCYYREYMRGRRESEREAEEE